MHKPLPSMESLISRNAKQVSEISHVYKSRMKRINSSYILIEFLSGRRSGADTVVNVTTIEFRFRAIVLIEKFVLDVAYEKIGVAGSCFCAHGHTTDLFTITVSE